VLLELLRVVIDVLGETVPLTLLKGEEDTLTVLDPDDDTLGDINTLAVLSIDALSREEIESNNDFDGTEEPVT